MNSERFWREIEKRKYEVLIGGIVALGVLGYGIFQIEKLIALPNSGSAPTLEPIPAQLLEAQKTPTKQATAESHKKVVKKSNTHTKIPGESCIYSAPWINAAATPIPDGGRSEYQGYPCIDGYWYYQGWYIKYDRNGTIIDRYYVDDQGKRIHVK